MIHLGDDMSNDMRSYLEKKLLETRTILLYGQINQVQAYDITQKLLLLSAMSNDDIKLIINSQGGHVESGDTIFDMIRYVEPKVKIIGTGFVASAGALIYASVPVERRYSLPNTRYMLHQPLGGARGQASDIEIEANEIIKMRKRLNQTFANATGHPLEKIEKDSDRNFWLSAEEAKDYKLVGHIISSNKEI